jgi:hypothetical protein
MPAGLPGGDGEATCRVVVPLLVTDFIAYDRRHEQVLVFGSPRYGA